MLKDKYSFLILLFSVIHTTYSQNVEISGKVKSKIDVENIHVINKTAKFFTVTNVNGEFTIAARLNDTLMFTSIQHKTKSMVINEAIISNTTCIVVLEELINELDQVTVGKILTGYLLLDVKNVEGNPPINFYDVGIPGYTGKIATQSERRLSEAGEFKPIMLLGLLGGGMPLNPVINGISGRTKMLKNRVEMERKADLLHAIKTNLSADFFSIYELDDNLKNDFFYFCEEDPTFEARCRNKSDIEVFEYLKEKYFQYKKNLNSKKE